MAYEAGKAHRALVDQEIKRLSKLMQELAVAQESMDAMAGVWSHLADSTTTTLDSLKGHVQDEISTIHDMLWTPEDFVGYDHVTVRVMDELYRAMPDLNEGATATDQRQLEIVRLAIDDVEAEVRALMSGAWQELLEASALVSISLEQVMEGLRSEDD